MTALWVALGAGVGAVLRVLVVTALDRPATPRGTLAVNVAGSFLLGLLVGADVGPGALALLGTGLCGGLTTFSALAVQAHGLGARRGTTYGVLTLAAALAACSLGWVLGGLLGGLV